MFSAFLRQEDGSTVVLFALALTIIMGFGSLVIDVGTSMVERRHLQNAIDAAVLAATTELPDTTRAAEVANEYIELNGYPPSALTISFHDADTKMSIVASAPVEYGFARIFGFASGAVGAGSSAAVQPMGGAFEYALFSGSTSNTLSMNGSGQYIGGSSHSNRNTTFNGSNFTLTGACESVTTVRVNGSGIDIGRIVEDAPFVAMPDFSDLLRTQAQQANQYYNGNQTYNGSHLTVNSPIYVNGNLTVNGSNFTGRGCIVATGNISFNGSNLIDSSGDAVCFYSKNGNITVNGSGITLDGIVYAPNGNITLNGSNQTIHGRVVGNTISINGSNERIVAGAADLWALPRSGVKLVR